MNRASHTFREFFHHPAVQALGNFTKKRGVELYLVGGSVRDLFLKRQTTDIDFALASDAIAFAKAFAASIKATCIVLEENPATARVVVKGSGVSDALGVSMDFAQFRAVSLTEDLCLRDLTINAMAVPFENATTVAKHTCEQNAFHVIDPCGGMKDLAAGLLRFPSEKVVQEDPVRLLRVYRFAAQLDFEISETALASVVKHRLLLSNVAVERCRDELVKIFKVKNAYPYLRQLETAGLLRQVLPSIKAVDGAWRSLQTFEKNPIPMVFDAYRDELNDYLQEALGVEADRCSFIKLSFLCGDDPSSIGKHLRLSRKTVRLMADLISGSKELRQIIPELTEKRIIDILRTYMFDWWGVLLYTAASYTVDSAVLEQIVDTYNERILPVRKQGRLITGRDLIRTFQLKEGKRIGNLLKEIEDRQFAGEIRTREEAFAAVAVLIQQSHHLL
ncbi:CCA tRNA nucleotidyltransferase [Candidatus Poribacteria bacterium]|nr:CCA tRNA nucleotidyltransferase [Candidatus Poribacteria bacterium]